MHDGSNSEPIEITTITFKPGEPVVRTVEAREVLRIGDVLVRVLSVRAGQVKLALTEQPDSACPNGDEPA